jgi:hypothetical protein
VQQALPGQQLVLQLLASQPIEAAGKLFFNKDEVQPDQLQANLEVAKARDPELRMQLQADDQVDYGTVVSIERAITKLAVITARGAAPGLLALGGWQGRFSLLAIPGLSESASMLAEFSRN